MIRTHPGRLFLRPRGGRPVSAQPKFEKDVIPTSKGDLEITFLGHATLIMVFEGKTIHVDPYGEVADYSTLPKADLILVTHDHFDHLDPEGAQGHPQAGHDRRRLRVLRPEACRGALIMANGDTRTVLGLDIEAVPAYNIVHKRPDGRPVPPQGRAATATSSRSATSGSTSPATRKTRRR